MLYLLIVSIIFKPWEKRTRACVRSQRRRNRKRYGKTAWPVLQRGGSDPR